jgi:hypothetical protein
MPRFDTSFSFGALARPKKPAAKPKAAKRPKGKKSKSRAFFGAMHGS